jgi:hypothetical protein
LWRWKRFGLRLYRLWRGRGGFRKKTGFRRNRLGEGADPCFLSGKGIGQIDFGEIRLRFRQIPVFRGF